MIHHHQKQCSITFWHQIAEDINLVVSDRQFENVLSSKIKNLFFLVVCCVHPFLNASLFSTTIKKIFVSIFFFLLQKNFFFFFSINQTQKKMGQKTTLKI
jgi:hypothetical protein